MTKEIEIYKLKTDKDRQESYRNSGIITMAMERPRESFDLYICPLVPSDVWKTYEFRDAITAAYSNQLKDLNMKKTKKICKFWIEINYELIPGNRLNTDYIRIMKQNKEGGHTNYFIPPGTMGMPELSDLVVDLTGFKPIKRPFQDWTLPQLYKHIHELEVENERLTEQAERQLEIINKMKFLDLFKESK